MAVLLAVLTAAAAPRAEAARPPVVMIVLDEFPVDTLLDTGGRIDARRFPNFARLARVSTWFPNAHTVYDSTDRAIPALLTGAVPDPSLRPDYRDQPHSVFTLLARRGYRMHVRESATTLCPPRLCRRTPDYGSPRPNILFLRRERLQRTIRSIRRRRHPSFIFHHAILPHAPWAYLPSGRQRTAPRGRGLPDFGAPPGFGDRFLTLHNQQRYLLQLGFVDRAIGRLLRRMRRARMLKRSMLVVTADHGLSFEVGVPDRREVTEANVEDIAPIPLFVKRPRQRVGTVNRVYARTVDVLPTIARVLGVKPKHRVEGRSLFDPALRRRGVRIVARDFSRVFAVPAEEIERRRRARIRERVAIFGTGAWRRVFQIGPNRRLLGRRTANLAIAGTNAVHARFAVPHHVRYRPRRGLAPVWLAGEIRGGESERDLAVAVNGKVRAVARSFRLEGDATEWFSVTVPEATLRRGPNRIALYEVSAGGGDFALTRLGGVR